MRKITCFIGLLIIAALACNAPIGGDETPSPSPPSTPAETTQPTPTATPPPTAEPPAETEPTPTTRPTFTPIQSTAPAGATAAATATPTGAATTAPQASATATADTGPLSFTYTIEWEVMSGNPGFAIATVTINATGGGGGYQYFRDDLPVDGPVFQYQWATCRANPGSLRVDSADGQSVRTDYYETPPCPATPST